MISLYGLETVIEKIGASAGPVSINGLASSAKGLVAATLVERLARPVVVVVDKASRAEEFFETLKFFMPMGTGAAPVYYYPQWEVLPYEETPPHPEIAGQRLLTLSELLAAPDRFVLVTTVEAMARRTVPPEVLRRAALKVKTGDMLRLERLAERLVSLGYTRAPVAAERGEFSIRGGIVDIFSGAGRLPVRIELFGDEVESVRFYNPDNQRSVEETDRTVVLPFREVFYHGRERDKLALGLRERAGEHGAPEGQLAEVEEALREGVFFDGMESLYPLFFPDGADIFDYLPPSAAIIQDEPDNIEKQLESFQSLIEEERAVSRDEGRIAPPPENLFLEKERLESAIAGGGLLAMRELAVEDGDERTFIIPARSSTRHGGDMRAFVSDLREKISESYTVILAASSRGGADRLSRILREEGLGAGTLTAEGLKRMVESLTSPQRDIYEENLYITAGKLASGFVIPSDRWAVMTEDEIFGKAPAVRHRVRRPGRAFETGVEDLKEGDLVVHRLHGVGRYVGNAEMTIGDTPGEYLEIEYAGRQKLFLPLYNIHLLKKYHGGGGQNPKLDKMGGATWRKTRSRVKKSVMEMAEKLLKIHAAREIKEGRACSPDGAFHREFADSFEYEETEGQLAACRDVAADMESPKPMDRLICGDVGYGKTEVAMRAAFKAVYDGGQVTALVPTTLLAQQHYQTFAERFKATPVSVEFISRFKSAKEQKDILERTAAGMVDILIGTHRLLQRDVKFKNLGLVIIDEEQRFGVAHKERLKAISRGVDVLTLSATPIPRTLHTAMLGIRDLSVIETPPPARMSIKTVITKFSDNVIREAVLREMDRGGQVFFVHNKVLSIHKMARYVQNVVPEARVAAAHGQMPERELERVMTYFLDRRFDVLVCTTIIESGLDIPSANTIIINRADQFGLAQLYQLRGRVGRDRHRAYGLLLVPGLSSVKDLARKRLKAIEELSELGSGFRLAARDMEIRGAGNLLGSEQSGHIDEVGFDTYIEMLQDAIRELKGEAPPERFDVSMNLGLDGRITPEYVPGLTQRMEFYNRLNEASGPEDVRELEAEMKDRFGPPPEETEKLLAVAMIRALCKRLKVERVDVIRDRLILSFDKSTPLRPDIAVTAAYELGRRLKFTSETTAEFTVEGSCWKARYGAIRGFLGYLLEGSAEAGAVSIDAEGAKN
ncbi:MAG: transcription-repair coupling factor [Candidatus Nitrospinota bacterium M3_3B_026]